MCAPVMDLSLVLFYVSFFRDMKLLSPLKIGCEKPTEARMSGRDSLG